MITEHLTELTEILEGCESIKLKADRVKEILDYVFGDKSVTDEDRSMISSKIKTRVQREAESALDGNYCWGAIFMATGTGKSKIAVDIIDRLFGSKLDAKVLIVVPTEKLRDENWKEEFDKWGKGYLWGKIQRACYASIAKYRDEEFDLVILDEGHNITPNNSAFFLYNKVAHCILLTATEPRDMTKKGILASLSLKPVYTISLEEAEKLGLVAPFDVTIMTIKLNNVDQVIESGNKKNRFFQTESAKYQYLSKICASSPNKMKYIQRMNFIYNLPSKTRAAKFILEYVIPKEDYKTIIFCQRIKTAEELCEHVFHSKSSDESYNLFKEDKINRMACVEAINEGENIENVDCAFIEQLNSNDLNLIQRIGRAIRFRPGHRAKIIILCVEDTVDKKWVESSLKTFSVSKITWQDLAEVKELLQATSQVSTIHN